MEERLLSLDLRHDASGRSKHERLRDHFVNEMIAGRLKPGEALPSERQLVETLGVAHMTIRQTMACLENEGLIRRVQGKGTFVEDDARRRLKRGLDIFALVVLETRSGFYPSLLHGFDASAAEINHRTIVCSTDDDVARQAEIVLQLLDQGIGGVAINPTNQRPTPAYQIRQLQQRGIPVVFLHRRVDGVAAPLLAIPYHEVGRTAGRVLAQRGHRRVAFFTTQPKPSVRACEEGFQEALQADGGVSIETVHVEDATIQLQEESTWAALQQMYARPDPPTAIFASFDSLAEMIYLRLQQLGLRVPDDVSLLGFGGSWRDGSLMRRLTSVVIDEVATGKQAVSLLHEMRRGDRPIEDNTEIVLTLELSDGETIAGPTRAIR
jgi:GntR family transcriptional regulator, arabinose operon transcriptional repressor